MENEKQQHRIKSMKDNIRKMITGWIKTVKQKLDCKNSGDNRTIKGSETPRKIIGYIFDRVEGYIVEIIPDEIDE